MCSVECKEQVKLVQLLFFCSNDSNVSQSSLSFYCSSLFSRNATDGWLRKSFSMIISYRSRGAYIKLDWISRIVYTFTRRCSVNREIDKRCCGGCSQSINADWTKQPGQPADNLFNIVSRTDRISFVIARKFMLRGMAGERFYLASLSLYVYQGKFRICLFVQFYWSFISVLFQIAMDWLCIW